ncbi:3' terminal RNA ribose 2'-O-methyltransferase Hen1 [Actinocorallia longicatena]|uniref:Small RNA 2'-O-methyltransferase n=2 Tax=Actinocorallia longicatena TaxID=111803 RepID=A0ABP6QBE2_9ACTN
MTPATELGFLLHKHPGRVQEFSQSYGTAHVFYPEAGAERCTAALMLEVDPITLSRTRARNSPDFSLGQYVNDRPYAASSLLTSAMNAVFRTAMRGRCASREELAASAIPLELSLPALPCRGGPDFARRLFEPLGWAVEAVPVPLDERFPEWGDSRYVTLTLRGTVRLADALNQLYVLLPVLDDAKHYWVAPDEVDKLIRSGDGWLAAHPERGRITRRYLGNRRTLVQSALARLAEVDDAPEDALATPFTEPAEQEHEKKVPLNELRAEAVLAALRQEDARSVIDLGCGPGALLARLAEEPSFTRIAGTDVAFGAVRTAHRRLGIDRLPRARAERITLFQGALTYADDRFAGYDAAVLMEVIEHVDPSRLGSVAEVVFGRARPKTVIVTTPNSEHNVRYEGLTGLRHPDHRFEWTRAQFRAWAEEIERSFGYAVRHVPVGEDDPEVGPPTQMGVFTR